jgi:hypothetical protein
LDGINIALLSLTMIQMEEFMIMQRLFVSMTVAGLLCGYMAMLYALMRIVVLIDHSYFVSLAM